MRYGSVCSGEVYGRLSVVEVYSPRRRDQSRAKCRCECGNLVDLPPWKLIGGHTKSCGCFRRDRAGGLYRIHGKSRTPEYAMFYDARKRAISKGLPFTIRPEDIQIPAMCPVLGTSLKVDGHRDEKPSLDRIVPSHGYTPSNIAVISFRANRIKSDANAEELRAVLAYVEAAS